ncbi:MAG TPA: glycosyltransferase family 39 protein [Blastocatellia bacterium]|nr:glycosyltransferase family 39 protein [Blastocatellia bacterium]
MLSTPNPETGFQSRFERATVFKTFAALVAITFLLRIFYAGHLYQDDGLWFTAAEEILRGKALYREIYFDKPPAIALVYAGLFKLFGASILTVRLFTIVYSVAISVVLYLFGKWLYARRAGLISAMMFAIFSTTYQTGHVQGLNTDFLMALPYAAGAYLFVRSRADAFHRDLTRAGSARLALGGGALTGLAFQINPKAAFDLIFFALFLVIARRWQMKREGSRRKAEGSDANKTAFFSFALALAGFAIGALPFLIYIAATKSLSFYWLYVWDWGARYARYYPAWKIAVSALTQSFDYFLNNNTLLVALLFVIVTVVRRYRNRKPNQNDTEPASEADFRADVTLLAWFFVSYAGLATGGRFFGHYFFQILPGLCLIGARGLTLILPALKARDRTQRRNLRRAMLVLLAAGFIITLVRFHARTARLAADRVRGAKSASTLEWFHERLNREEQMVAAAVRDLDEEPAADQFAAGAMRDESPRERGAQGPSDYLFVWGYRPEIYYWSGLIPASKYLSSQPLTGVPADVHYFGEEYRSVLEESATQAARAELARELEQTRPEHIVDELGAFNPELSINSYPELREFMSGYKDMGMIERFIIYRRKDFTKGYRKRNPEAQP